MKLVSATTTTGKTQKGKKSKANKKLKGYYKTCNQRLRGNIKKKRERRALGNMEARSKLKQLVQEEKRK